MYYMLIGVIVVTVVGTVVSCLTGGIKAMDKMDTKLLVPLVKEWVDRRQTKYLQKLGKFRPETISMLNSAEFNQKKPPLELQLIKPKEEP